MQLTGSQILIECLKEQGVDTVFGYPGGAILNVYDELYKHSDEIKHILTSHEQGASSDQRKPAMYPTALHTSAVLRCPFRRSFPM